MIETQSGPSDGVEDGDGNGKMEDEMLLKLGGDWGYGHYFKVIGDKTLIVGVFRRAEKPEEMKEPS
jgi:hypothetical protein